MDGIGNSYTELTLMYFAHAGTPFWKLVLKQFDDLLVKILIAAAVVSFILALINGETGLTAFLEPSVGYVNLLFWLAVSYYKFSEIFLNSAHSVN
jgi:magnesium-transporting ATPase (P-type)